MTESGVPDRRSEILAEAVSWHFAQNDMREDDWVRFVDWLEASPVHASAYDRVVLNDAALDGVPNLVRMPVPSGVPAGLPTWMPRRRWAAWGGGAAIAASALALAPSAFAPTETAYETRPGQSRSIQLGDGSSIDLSGGTRLTVAPGNRLATLERGEALFRVRHDASHPFTLVSGELTVRDVGTVFNVARDGRRLDVQVAEGAVVFQPQREAVALHAGTGLSAREDRGTIALTRLDVTNVGSWRSGRVSFADDTVDHLAQVVHRVAGYRLALDAGLSARPFTGTVTISGSAERDVPNLAALIGARWHKDGERWLLSSSPTPHP